MKSSSLFRQRYIQVIFAVILGICFGHFWPDLGRDIKPVADAFIKLIRMMLAPLVFSTIVLGIASHSHQHGSRVASTLLKSMGLFYFLTLLALLAGWLAATLLQPGVGWHLQTATIDRHLLPALSANPAEKGVSGFLMQIIPTTFVGAFTEPEILPVLLLAMLTGFAIAHAKPTSDHVLKLMDELGKIFFSIFDVIMKLAPLAAFASMAFTVGQHGIQSLAGFSYLILSFYLACTAFVMLVLGGLARWHGFSLWKLIRYIREELLVVLGNSSSEPVLPPLLQKLQMLGCKKDVSGLVLPMAYSFNLDGTAIYLTLASLFIAQACDVQLSNTQIMSLIATMLLTSKGAAGVSGSGFVALVATLSIIPDLPLEGATLLLGIDRFMSEARALTSTVSNVVVCLTVSIWEGACDRKLLQQQLDQA